MVAIECTREERIAKPSPPPTPTPQVPQETAAPVLNRSTSVCGRNVDYTLDRSEKISPFLGIWTGNWNNAGRLCGGLIVEKVRPNGTAEILYVYGPSQPGSKLAWKQQRRTGLLDEAGRLSFQDDQGSTFRFDLMGPSTLSASFLSGSGRLSGSFQRN